jgi:hypothetical protein
MHERIILDLRNSASVAEFALAMLNNSPIFSLAVLKFAKNSEIFEPIRIIDAMSAIFTT